MGRCALCLPPGESPAGYPRRAMLGTPQRPPNRLRRIGQTTAATSAIKSASRCLEHELVHRALKSGRLRPPGRWPVAPSCCASSRLRRLAPFGLSSFPRSARLTPPARLPDPGLRASLAVQSAHGDGRCLSSRFPSLITLSATVARGLVPSRRAGPCPRLRLRAAPTLRLSP